MKKFLSIMLIPTLFLAMIPTVGCTATQINNAVAEVNTYLPTVLALLQDAITIYGAVGASAPDKAIAQSSFNIASTDLTDLQTETQTYLSLTSTSTQKATAWTNIQALVNTLVTNSDQTLQLASIKDANSMNTGIIALASLNAAMHILDGYITSAQTPAQVKAKTSARAIKLKTVSQYWSPSDKTTVSSAFGYDFNTLYQTASAKGF